MGDQKMIIRILAMILQTILQFCYQMEIALTIGSVRNPKSIRKKKK